MPFYHDSVFGPSEDSQLRPPAPALTSPMDDRPRPALRRTSLPPPEESDDNDHDNSPRRPFRVPREVMSPAPSPIPISPTYYSYRNDDEEAERDERGEAAAAEEMVEEADELEAVDVRRASRHHRQQQERAGGKSSRGGPVQASEKYVSIPRNGRDASAFSNEDEDDSVGQDDDDQADVERKDRRSRRHAGLVSSRPRSSPQKRAERVPLAVSVAPSPSAPARATDDVKEDKGEGEVRRPQRGSRHASSRRAASRSRHRHHRDSAKVGSSSDSASDIPPQRSDEETESEGEEDDEKHEKRRRRHARSHKTSPSRNSRQLPSTPEMHCRRCGYLLPAEMAAYVLETSAYASVPQPHCPACGSRLRNITPASDTEEDGENRLRQRRGSEALHRTAAPTSAPPHRSAVRRHAGEQEVNLYSDPEAEEVGPRGARVRTVAAAQPGRPQPSLSPSSLPTTMLVPKSPYLTLEFMPHTLSSTMRKQHATQPQDRYAAAEEDNIEVGKAPPIDLEHTGVPWATPGCSACCWQCGVSLAGVCCCCAMPCVLFRERQQLLFHELESRYICCAGAFPCCVPPASLRPELYYTVQAVLPTRMRSSNYWEDAVEVSHDGAEASGGGGQLAAPAASTAPRRATLRSATGIASPSSLVNPRTGLPLEGCYHNTNASHGAHGSAGTGCCDCVSCVDHTCVWDCSKGCCLACTHPTAHCLACPLCCLCCELTCCMPCALWANRLLIRQHYNLAPDPSIDAGAACCYSCCLTCCTCQAVSVVSKHHASAQQQQQRSSRAVANASSLSCWSQLATSVAACLAAVCCLCPCAACSLAQQRDQRERLGYPLVVNMPPEMEML